MGSLKVSILRALDIGGVLTLMQFVARNNPRVIMYHRGLNAPFIASVDPAHFDAQIASLVRHFRVLPIAELIAQLQSGTLKPYSVALTFDDGYSVAWPILRIRDVPTSLFVTSDFVDGSFWLWPDKLKYVLLETAADRVDVESIGRLTLTPDTVVTMWSKLGNRCLPMTTGQRESFIAELARTLSVEIPLEPIEPFLS